MEHPEHSVLIAFIKGDLNDPQRVEVRNWIASSPKHQAHFERIRDIWDLHGQKAEQYQPEMDVAWQRIEGAIEDRPPVWHWVYRVAAGLVLMLGIAYFMINHQGTPSTLGLVEHVAGSSSKIVNLPDGSIITLNQGSKITFNAAFDQSIRQLQLVGEAFFEIARDENRPFIIETSRSKTQVLGTSFSISESEILTTLTVVSGKVSFSSKSDESVILTKGDRGTISSSGQLTKSKNVDPNFLSWQTGNLVFENASIGSVLTDLEQHYEVHFRSESSITTTLTAQFNNQSLEEVLEIVSSTLDIEITPVDSTTYIVK